MALSLQNVVDEMRAVGSNPKWIEVIEAEIKLRTQSPIDTRVFVFSQDLVRLEYMVKLSENGVPIPGAVHGHDTHFYFSGDEFLHLNMLEIGETYLDIDGYTWARIS